MSVGRISDKLTSASLLWAMVAHTQVAEERVKIDVFQVVKEQRDILCAHKST